MALAFDNQLQYWSERIRTGPAGEFLGWWTGELRALLPRRWQERLRLSARRLILTFQPGAILLGIEEGGSLRPLETIALNEDPALQREHVAARLEQGGFSQLPRFLGLGIEHVLRKELNLPAAAESSLQQVLTFEMDRQTPFRAADVYFAWRLLRGAKETGQLQVEILVSPRGPVDRSLDILAGRGLPVAGVDIVENGRTLGVNMLPPEKRHRVTNPRSRVSLALAAGFVLLLVFVMMQSLNVRAHRVAKLEEAIAAVQDEARRVQRLREQLLENSEAASFLVKRRASLPMAIEIIADVTRTLPDDTYLDRLVIDQDSVLMQGKSRNAQQLIEVVNKSEMMENAAFRGSTRLDAATGLEIFEVNAAISKGGKG